MTCEWNWARRIGEAADRIRRQVRTTPLELSSLNAGAPARVFLKLEHLQHTGSFKFRGAANKLALLTPEDAKAGVVTASNGNHALAVAAAAQARGIAAEVFVSAQVSRSKLERIGRYGACIREAGKDPLQAELAARKAAGRSLRTYISPYNDSDVIAGQGTIAIELYKQLPRADAIFAAVGGGGLIGGVGAYLKQVSPKTEIVGCWPINSPVLYECMQAAEIVEVPEQPTISESTAGGLEPRSVTLDLCRNVIDRSVLVSEEEIIAAMRRVLETEHWLIEGAAGVAVAAFLREAEKYEGKTVVIIICGRNLSSEALEKLL